MGIFGDFGLDAGRRLFGLGGNTAFLSDPAHAKSTYNIESGKLETNMPRFNFQFLVVFELSTDQLATEFYKRYFPSESEFQGVNELVKSVGMPSMNIETEILNQYNRKRVSQKKINFEPIELVMHDVVDGKTLRFWEMYYEYYFKDGVNFAQRDGAPPTDAQLNLIPMPQLDQRRMIDIQNSPNSETKLAEYKKELRQSAANVAAENERRTKLNEARLEDNRPTKGNRDVYTTGKRFSSTGALNVRELRNDIVEDEFNGNYGYNLERVNGERYLIKTMDIYQFHGGRFSKVTLVNPRISAFSHTTLSQDSNELSELSFTIEYEDAIYLNKNKDIPEELLSTHLFDSHYNEIELAESGGGVISEFIDSLGLAEGSVLGSTLDSTVGLLGDQLPDQYLKAASSSIFGSGQVPYPDAAGALKNVGSNAVTNAKGVPGTAFTSTGRSANSNYNPFRR